MEKIIILIHFDKFIAAYYNFPLNLNIRNMKMPQYLTV